MAGIPESPPPSRITLSTSSPLRLWSFRTVDIYSCVVLILRWEEVFVFLCEYRRELDIGSFVILFRHRYLEYFT